MSHPPAHRTRTGTRALALAAAASLTLLAGCAGTTPGDVPPSATAGSPGAASPTEAGPDADAPATSDITESPAVRPRLVLSYDGGVAVLDAGSLELVGTVAMDGFVRLNAAGDGRHALVSTSGGFQALDAGTWGEAHGDHAHYFNAAPMLTDVVFPAETPGHVVVHAGRTVLFDDGTGTVLAVDSSAVGGGPAAGNPRGFTTPQAHHGVAVELADGTVLVTEGDPEQRTGVRALDADGRVTAESAQCPGVHGEAVAADEAAVFGCTDGALVFSGGTFTKVDSPDADGKLGTLTGSPASGVVLGDYTSESRTAESSAADGEETSFVSLIDTATASMKVVELPAGYTFRSLGRGAHGEALVLGTDGALHVIDPGSGHVESSIAVVEPWTAPDAWQEPRPTLLVFDGSAYVTDPARRTVHAVDVETGQVWRSAQIDVVPNEIVGITGEAPGVGGDHDHEDDEHHDHDHEGDGHDH